MENIRSMILSEVIRYIRVFDTMHFEKFLKSGYIGELKIKNILYLLALFHQGEHKHYPNSHRLRTLFIRISSNPLLSNQEHTDEFLYH